MRFIFYPQILDLLLFVLFVPFALFVVKIRVLKSKAIFPLG